ncbi:MAG: hypothetical protein RL187_928, partial [Actinomycetota bacterium]
AACAARALGVSSEEICRGLGGFTQVPGRLEKVPNDLGLVILVDYAHKPDALEKVLRTLHEVRAKGARIITVVGYAESIAVAERRTESSILAKASDTVLTMMASAYTESAIITLTSDKTEIPRSGGIIMNSARDGIV